MLDYQGCFKLKVGKELKTQINITEYDEKKHGKNLYLVTSPFTDNRTTINFKRGEFFAISKEDEKYLDQSLDFITRLNKTEKSIYVSFQERKQTNSKFKLPDQYLKLRIKFPITFKAIDIIGDWKAIDLKMVKNKKDRKEFGMNNSYYKRQKLEMDLVDERKKNKELNEKVDSLLEIKKEMAELKELVAKK